MGNPGKVEPVHRAGHPDIGEQDGDLCRPVVQKLKGLSSIFGFERDETGFAQELNRHRAQKRLVLDDENPG